MRYQNWDVLLFPGDSRTPLQEFKTQCSVISTQGGDFLTLPQQLTDVRTDPSVEFRTFPNNDLDATFYESMTQVPILTSFVPSLDPGLPFRVSVHSWAKPIESSLLLCRKTDEEKATFEARVYIDGVLHA